MGTSIVGMLKVLLSADSAQITTDLGKARKAVNDARSDFAMFGRGGKDAEKVLIEIGSASTRELGKARQAVQVLTQGFGSLGGTVGRVGGLIGDLTTGGLGAFGAAAAGAAAAVAFAAHRISSAYEEMGAAEAAYLKGSQDRMEKAREVQAAALDKKMGGVFHRLRLAEQEALAAEARAEEAQKAFDASGVGNRRGGPQEAALNRAKEEAAAARDRANAFSTEKTEDERKAVDLLSKAWEGLNKARADTAFRKTIEGLPEPLRQAHIEIRKLREQSALKLEEELKAAGLTLAAVEDTARSEADRNLLLIRRQGILKANAGALKEMEDHILGKARGDVVSSLQAELAGLQKKLDLKKLGLEAQADELAIQERIDELGKRPDLGFTEWLHLKGILQAILRTKRELRELDEAPGKEAAAQRLRDQALEQLQGEEDRAARRRREQDEAMDRAGERGAADIWAQQDIQDFIDEARRTSTERELQAIDEKYAEALELAHDYGFKEVELARLIEHEKAEVRAEAAREARAKAISDAIGSGTFGEGFQARVSQLREETAGWGRLGAQMADLTTSSLSGGVVSALEEVTRGTKEAKEAFRDWSQSFFFDAARMIQQALLLKAVLQIFPGLQYGPAPAAGGAGAGAAMGGAHGGTFQVGGYGGLDSQLVQMRLTPGEVVKVTNGANAGAGGPMVQENHFHIRSTVLAEDVARRMGREAKAGIVAEVLHRPSRRGSRAQE